MEWDCTPEGFAGRVKQLRELNDPDKFFTFFDGGGTADGAFNKAYGIFERLMLPWAPERRQTSLDIGYGGGGQVLIASQYFDVAIGIDVHGEHNYVYETLSKRSRNIKLIQGDGESLKRITNNSIDFIHSWTTFMHVGTIEVVKSYLREIHRVLRPGGTAIIYFCRLLRSGKTWAHWKEDIDNEKTFAERHGKIEVNQINLMIGLKYFESLVEEAGLIPFDRTASYGELGVGGQHGVAMRKE